MSIVTPVEAIDHLNVTAEHEAEIEVFIAAVNAHITRHYGALPSGTYTELVPVVDDGSGVNRRWLRPLHAPVLTVTSATDEHGTAYSTGFTIAPDGYAIRHDNITSGDWTVVYTAGEAEIPADLKLAALEDIRGLWQPGQIGPPAEVGTTYRPVRMWPRVDAWIEANTLPGIA
jgi:hypothetical protein